MTDSMPTSHRQLGTFAGTYRYAFLCTAVMSLLAFSGVGNAATVRDNFTNQLYSNNDGTVNWSGDWVEVDG